MKRRMMTLMLAAVLGTGVLATSSQPASAREFNDQYVYATTRSVSNMDANPGLKATLFPVTLIVDTALLPFAVIAGFVT